MLNTANNQVTSRMPKRNDRRSIANTDATYNESSGPLHGGAICKKCGGKIRMKDVVAGAKQVGKMIKPYAHQAIKKGAIALGTTAGSYFGAPAVGSVLGNELGNAVSSGYDKIVGGKVKSTKGSKSKTHVGDLDYTTKLGDTVYHIGGHDVKKSKKPYTGGAVKKQSPWIAHVLAFSKAHKMKYSDALKNPQCKSSYHSSK